MYYVSTNDLPQKIRDDLSPTAQSIYIDAFNTAYARFAGSMYSAERTNSKRLAHKIALATVKYRAHVMHQRFMLS